MEKDNISLVFFTVLSQTAAGGFLFRELLIHSGRHTPVSKEFRVLSLLVTGVFITLALVTAFLHLGKQAGAVYALKNIKTSWLSREVLFIIIFSATVLFYWLNERYWNITAVNHFLTAAGIFSAAGLLASMSAVYMLPAVPSWNTPLTPVSFLLTAAAAGMSLIMFLKSNYGSSADKISLAVLAAVLLSSAVISVIMLPPDLHRNIIMFLITRIISVIIPLIIIFLIYFRIIPNKMPAVTVLFITVLITELSGRMIFFLNYHKSGL